MSTKIVYLIVIGVFLFCRLYNLENRLAFDRDPERDAFAVKQILVEKKPILLGQQSDNEKGFFMAPFYFYSLVPFYWLGNMHPLPAMEMYVVFHLLGFISLILLFFKKIFGNRKTLILLSIMAINPILTHFQAVAWNPAIIPTGVIIFWITFFLAYQKNRVRDYIFLGLLTGIFTHFHFLFIFQGIPIVLLFLRNKNRQEMFVKIFVCFVSFFLTFLPIVIFDLRHNFLNLKLLGGYFSRSAQPAPIPGFNFATYFDVFFTSFVPFAINIWESAIIYVAMIFCTLFFTRAKHVFTRLFWQGNFLILTATALFFFFYRGKVSEYYFLYIFIIFFFVIAEILSHLNNLRNLIVISIILIINWPSLKDKFVNASGLNLKNKDLMVKKLKSLTKNQEVYVAIDTALGLNYGFYYLIDYHKVRKSNSPHVPLYIIKTPPVKEAAFTTGAFSLITPKE